VSQVVAAVGYQSESSSAVGPLTSVVREVSSALIAKLALLGFVSTTVVPLR